jgi:hypothetical protein
MFSLFSVLSSQLHVRSSTKPANLEFCLSEAPSQGTPNWMSNSLGSLESLLVPSLSNCIAHVLYDKNRLQYVAILCLVKQSRVSSID